MSTSKYALIAVAGYLAYRALKNRGAVGDPPEGGGYATDIPMLPIPSEASPSQVRAVAARQQVRAVRANVVEAYAPISQPARVAPLYVPTGTPSTKTFVKPTVTKNDYKIYEPGQFDITGKPVAERILKQPTEMYAYGANQPTYDKSFGLVSAISSEEAKILTDGAILEHAKTCMRAVSPDDAKRCMEEHNAMVEQNKTEAERAADRLAGRAPTSPLQVMVDTLGAKSTAHQKGMRRMIKEMQDEQTEWRRAQEAIDAKGAALKSQEPDYGSLTTVGKILNAASVGRIIGRD